MTVTGITEVDDNFDGLRNLNQAVIMDSIIYKEDIGTDLRTFVDCKYNYVYNSDDDLAYRNYNSDDDLAYRNCTRCLSEKPLSYGFQDT